MTSYPQKIIADKKPVIIGSLRLAAAMSGFFAPGISERMHAAADKLDGTVQGVEKNLAERWAKVVLVRAAIEGESPATILTTGFGVRGLQLIHEEMIREAQKKQGHGMNRLEAQTNVLDRWENYLLAIAHLRRPLQHSDSPSRP